MSKIAELQRLSAELLANGKIDGHEVGLLRDHLAQDGKVDRLEVELLVNLYRQLKTVSPAFERFFNSSVKKHVLCDGVFGREEVHWLRNVIFHDGEVRDRERKLLREIRGEATAVCPEAEELFEDCGL